MLKGGADAPDMLMTIFGEKPVSKRPRRKTGSILNHISKDVGCPDISPSCLTCPLPICIEEMPIPERMAIRLRLSQERAHNANL
jgi:hypothetical protein